MSCHFRNCGRVELAPVYASGKCHMNVIKHTGRMYVLEPIKGYVGAHLLFLNARPSRGVSYRVISQ